jgi:hypothetical protein
MANLKKISDVPVMNDDELAKFWESNEPESFEGWKEGELRFTRPPKKLIQLRLDPEDVRIIDRESKLSGIDRAQLVRSWVKEKIRLIRASARSSVRADDQARRPTSSGGARD